MIVKCSLELIARPFTVLNVPLSELKFMILKVDPMLGTKPLIKLMFRIPFRFALVGFSSSYFVPAVVPPMEISRVPVEVCV